MTPEFVGKLRGRTPGCQHRIHLNNAGAALPPQEVVQAVQQYLEQESITGGYETAALHEQQLKQFYTQTARLLNAHSRNIAWVTNATDAYNKALSSIPFEKGDVIISSDDDYASNQIAFLQLQARFGVQLIRAATLPEGGVDPQSVEELVKKHRPRLVAITPIPTNSGLIQDVETIGQICAEHQVLYLVDACQSAGQLPLDVQQLKCSFLSATSRKFLRGPRGGGFLYVADEVLEKDYAPLFLDLHSGTWTADDRFSINATARRFELWERSYAIVAGTTAAIKLAMDIGLEDIADRVQELARITRERLATLPGIRVLDQGTQKCGIVTAAIEGVNPQQLVKTLHDCDINISVTSREGSRLDFAKKNVEWAARVSPHYYNMKEEIESLENALEVILK